VIWWAGITRSAEINVVQIIYFSHFKFIIIIMAMFLKSGEDDDMDFGSGSGSKLASLFGFNQESSDKNQSLTYTAPKQPRKDSGRREAAEKSQASSAMACLHAVPVTAYKFEKGQYVNQGKVGAAIVGSQEISNYKMILYKGKQQQIVAVMISTQFKFTVQPNNYANIYDDQRQNWSILFDTKDAVVAFAKHVALAMANSVGKNELKSTVIQDLVVGEGFSLGKGDMAEIKYTGWLMNQNTFGQVFDKNVNAEKPFRLKLGKGKVIKGWEEGVVGMKTDGLRLLIVPPSLAYGSQGMGNRVPPDSTLIFEVEVIKMKTNKDKSDSPRSATSGLSDSESSSDVKPVKPPKPRSPSVNSVGNVRKRAESVTEQLASSPKSNKANIISRMAKMGQPMLPLHGAIPAQLSDDSDADEVEATKAESLPVEVPASEVPTANKSVASNESSTKQSSESSTSKSHSNSSFKPRVVATEAVDGSSVPLQVNPHQQLSLLQTNPYIQHASMMSSAAFPSPGFQQQHVLPQYLPMQSVPSSSSGADSHLSILLSETRTQNTELRFNLSKISDKVDTVINKIDNMKAGYSPSSSLVPSSGMSLLEPSMLLHSIEKMVQENTSLRKELD
ncbi:FKBP15 (predicted), partial [Pycnogonum litorale]